MECCLAIEFHDKMGLNLGIKSLAERKPPPIELNYASGVRIGFEQVTMPRAYFPFMINLSLRELPHQPLRRNQ